MKRTALLNRHLSALIAELGHLDEVVVADAGLPAPPGVPVIDLAIRPGLPGFADMLEALRTEMVIEGAVHATEARPGLVATIGGVLKTWEAEQGKPIAVQSLPHAAFKARSGSARAIIRTGECTPYANLILISGVPF